MNHKNKLRNSGVAIQLGDPLPLPYKVDTQPHIKDEDDTAVETRHNTNILHEPVLYHRNISTSLNDELYKNEDLKMGPRTINLTKPRPIPIRRNYLNPRVVSKEISLPKAYDKQEHLQLMESIEGKLERVKRLMDYKQLSIDYDHLQSFDNELSRVLQEHEELDETNTSELDTHEDQIQQHEGPTILDELEKLQQVTHPDHTLRYAIIAAGVLIFLVSSFMVSGLNYDYCYYFC